MMCYGKILIHQYHLVRNMNTALERWFMKMFKNFLKSKKGFTLVEVILSIALLGILSVATITIFSTGLNILSSAASATGGTQIAADDLENWYSGNYFEDVEKTTGSFTIAFPSKTFEGTGEFINGKDNNQINTLKTFTFPNYYALSNEAIVSKNDLVIDGSISSTVKMNIYSQTYSFPVDHPVTGVAISELYSDISPMSINFVNYTYKGAYQERYTIIPIAPTAQPYVEYEGVNKTFDLVSANTYFYASKIDIIQDAIITVNNDTAGSKRKLFIYIRDSFGIRYNKRLSVNILGNGASHTSVYFIYCGSVPATLEGEYFYGNLLPSLGIVANTTGCYIYSPGATISLIGSKISGVVGQAVSIKGDTTFLQNNDLTNKPSWQDLIVMLEGS